MPPKGDPSLMTERDQLFLIECIRQSKEKLVPDFEVVAQATSMTKKGAANKFRDIMKRFGTATNTSGDNDLVASKSTIKRAKPTATKKDAAPAETASDDGEDEGEEDEPPRKKANTAKARAKAPAKSKPAAKKGIAKRKVAVKSEAKVEEDSSDEAGDAGEGQCGEADMNVKEESV